MIQFTIQQTLIEHGKAIICQEKFFKKSACKKKNECLYKYI